MKSRGLLLPCSVAAEGARGPAPAPAAVSPATNSSTSSPGQHLPDVRHHPPAASSPKSAAGGRCAATAYRKPCLFFWRKCCAACLCVPAGTYGNKASCPCYNNWKTKRGGPKCP